MNPKYTANGNIDLIYNHPVYGEIPFTASPDDGEELGRELYARAIAGEFGPIAEYVAPVPTLAQRKAEAQAYLNSTDWYFARLAETGQVVPQEVLTKRSEARAIMNEVL